MADSSEDRTDDAPRLRPLDILFRGAAEGLSALVLFALMVMTCIDVFGREALNAPLDGATELTQLMLGIIVFAVLPVVSYRGDHVSVDLLDRWFPARLARPRQIVLNFLMSGMMAVVCWRVWIIGALQTDYGDTTEFLRIPLGPISMFIAVASGIAAVAMFANAIRIALGRPDPASDNTQIS